MNENYLKFASRIEWPTVAMLLVCYTTWFAAGIWLSDISLWLALPMMAVAVALHSSLQHEACHGHPTRNAAFNELLVALPLGVVFPYRRFKQMHLRHHCDERLTDPYDDPESWYIAQRDWQAMPSALRTLLTLNNTLIGRIVIGPLLMVVAFVGREITNIEQNKVGVRRAWLHHLAGLVVLTAIVTAVFDLPFWLYAIAVAYPAMSIIAIRTYCEHRWSHGVEGRTIIVENSRILSWLFLNNSLHLVHHAQPTLPWYQLPARFREERDVWVARNNGYVFNSYWDIAKAYALRRKEPVAHPALHTGEATIPAHSVDAHVGQPLPAKPQIR